MEGRQCSHQASQGGMLACWPCHPFICTLQLNCTEHRRPCQKYSALAQGLTGACLVQDRLWQALQPQLRCLQVSLLLILRFPEPPACGPHSA